MSATVKDWALSDAQRERYAEDGYVIPALRLPEERLQMLDNALQTVVGAYPEVRPERLTGAHIASALSGSISGRTPFLDMALDPDLLDLVADVLGDDIAMWGLQLFCKPGGHGWEVPMHQDGQYWPIRPLATCTVWIALDDSDRGNGCLSVVPGSHCGAVNFEHRTRDDEALVLNQAVDDSRVGGEVHYIELERGQMSLHDVYLVHGSAPNTSGRRRAGFAIRYMPTTSWFRRDLDMAFGGYSVDWESKPIWLARGVDRCGMNDFIIGHD